MIRMSFRFSWPVALVALGCAARGCAAPVAYQDSAFHLEARPPIEKIMDAGSRQAAESALAQAGITGRWIRVTANNGDPLIKNPYLPCPDPNAAANEATLKAWVEEMHANGESVISWVNSRRCDEAVEDHPDWLLHYFGPGENQAGKTMCALTGWGDAFANYCNYCIDRLGLDGLYIDGAFLQPGGAGAGELACCCDTCQAKFKADTGLTLPTSEDWNDPTYRRWVQWRYATHAGFYSKLASQIHAAHPNATVFVNNYHRWDMSWTTGMPLDIYPGDFYVAAEGNDPQHIDGMARMLRAYGRKQVELWGEFHVRESPFEDAQPLAQVATSCYVAGAVPAYGAPDINQGRVWNDPRYAETAKIVAPILSALRPWARNVTLPYVGVHWSQQTETFYFGRGETGSFKPYWTSLHNWIAGLDKSHVPVDAFFDGDFTAEKLATYKVVVLPLSFGLSAAQAQTLLDWVKGGGVAVLGPAAGQLDAQGQPVAQNPLGTALGFSFAGTPAPTGTQVAQVQLATAAGGVAPRVEGMYTPLTLADPAWSPLYNDAGTRAPVVAERTWGAGHVLVAAIDPASVLEPECQFDNQTSITPTGEQAANGRYSLKFVEGPIASRPELPRLMAAVPPFDASQARGGEVHCDLRLEPGATVDLQFGPAKGPLVRFGINGGHITSGGKPLAPMNFNQWIHLDLIFRWGGECTYDLSVSGGARGEKLGLTPPDKSYGAMNWLEFTGRGGQAGAAFYLDNLQIVEDTNAGQRQLLVNDDFADGGATVTGQTYLVQLLAARVAQLAPPPVWVAAPDTVRAGFFPEDATHLLVHLDNSIGTTQQWQAGGGPAATISCAFAVKSAKLALTGAALKVTPQGAGAEIAVPSVGLYQVVEVEKG
jgi:hypothetical protein